MARLPTRDDLGGLPSVRTGTPTASFDVSAIGRGAASMGQGVAAFGRGFEVAGAALAEVGRRQELFKTEAKFQEFQFQEQQNYIEAQRSVTQDNIGSFTKNWQEGYLKRAKSFMKEAVPSRFRQQYHGKLFDTERTMFGNAMEFQFVQQRNLAMDSIDRATANIYATKAREVGTDGLDEAMTGLDELIQSNSMLTELEKVDMLQKQQRVVALAHINSLTPDRVESLLRHPEKAPKVMEALTASDRETLINQAIDAQEDDPGDQIVKEGWRLVNDDAMTPEWLADHEEFLSPSVYQRMLWSMRPDSETRKTDPQDYIRFSKMLETDPQQVKDETLQMFGNGTMAKADWLRLSNEADRILDKAGPKDYSDMFRRMVKNMLITEYDDYSIESGARQIEAAKQYDDWIRKHPNASYDDVRVFTQKFIQDFLEIQYADGSTQFPVPMYVTKPRNNLKTQDIREAIARTQAAHSSQEIDDLKAAEQAALLRRWLDIVEGRE